MDTPTPAIIPSAVSSLNAARASAVNSGASPYAGNLQNYSSYTAGDVYKNAGVSAPSSPLDAGLSDAISQNKKVADTPIDENAIRDNIMKQFQGEIDATNTIFGQKLNEAKTQGLGRLGSAAAIAGRSGTAGSDFGVAQNDNVVTQNNGIEGSIQAEQAAAIAAIMGKGRAESVSEIAAKRDAQKQGLDAYITHLGEQGKRTQDKTTQLAGLLLSKGQDPNTLDPSVLKSTAEAWGVQPNDVISAYTTQATAKKTADTEQAIKEADLQAKKTAEEKSRYIPVGDGGQLYDTQTGTVVAENVKNFAPNKYSNGPIPPGTGNTPISKEQISLGEKKLNAARGGDGYTDTALYNSAYQDWITKQGTLKTFLSAYPPKNYLNPKDPSIPSYFKASLPKSGSSVPVNPFPTKK